jgi:hypothetical protein
MKNLVGYLLICVSNISSLVANVPFKFSGVKIKEIRSEEMSLARNCGSESCSRAPVQKKA